MNIVEFAKELNLSIGTVSRALNDRPEVSGKTRQLVLSKAQELGFTPNANARRLVTGVTNLFQLECPCNTHILSDGYLIELARAIESAAGEHGYDLLLHLGTQRRGSSELKAVDGLIIVAGQETTEAEINLLTSSGRIPSVVIMDASATPVSLVPSVRLDHLTGVREALSLLSAHGHERIAYIGSGQPGAAVSNALPSIMAEIGLPWNPDYIVEAGAAAEAGAQAAAGLLKRPVPPTAFFARTDILANAVVQTAQQMGLSVPGDISVIGHDNIELAAHVNPPLTTVAVDIPSVARAAVNCLIAVIAGGQPTSEVLGTHLVIRESVGPAC